VRYALAISVVLALGYAGKAIGADRPLRLAQSQTSAACISNCNSAYATCANQCPAAATTSQVLPDINVATNIQGNRAEIVQNNQPIQCRLNCTSQQQFCWSTCR
jgi:hypothetical protein